MRAHVCVLFFSVLNKVSAFTDLKEKTIHSMEQDKQG